MIRTSFFAEAPFWFDSVGSSIHTDRNTEHVVAVYCHWTRSVSGIFLGSLHIKIAFFAGGLVFLILFLKDQKIYFIHTFTDINIVE